MFDIGWSEMAVIAVVALVVIGPKELPGALKTFAYWMKQARKMAREFQSGVDEIVREAELEDARKAVSAVTGRSVNQMLEKTIDPTGEMKKALNEDDLKKSMSVTAQATTPIAASGSSSTTTSTSATGTPSIPVAAPAAAAPAPAAEPTATPEAKTA
ncbi:MAG TPA: Sec-independent protein translocase protein TatB [Verrucomicrobiae bacterium]|nr:Sec-independent protein translocase protein TatB [Verrucomicrobiae bacterium]